MMNLNNKIELIEKYAQLINDELGEYWLNLTTMYSSRDFFIEEFSKAYESTINDTYDYIKENARVKVTEETYSQKFREVIFLDNYDVEDGDVIEELK